MTIRHAMKTAAAILPCEVSKAPAAPRQRGFALLAVLWIAGLLAIIAVAFTDNSRTDMQLARNLEESARASALAEAGVARAIYALLEPSLERRWRADGFVYALPLDGGVVHVAVQDEAGKIDINHASAQLLAGLFGSVGVDARHAEGLAEAIADWQPPGIAQANAVSLQTTAGTGTSSIINPDRFASLFDLIQVPGMTPEIFHRVAADLTIYSGRPLVNVMTAPADVLYALPDLKADDVRSILAVRAEPGNPAELLDKILAIGGGKLGVLATARTFTIRAEARTDSGATFTREAVVALPHDAAWYYQFYVWQRGR